MKYELIDPMTLIDPADMVDPVDLLRARLSGQLERPTEAKVMCKVQTRHGRTGYVTNTCTAPSGHEGAHRDMHTGATWRSS